MFVKKVTKQAADQEPVEEIFTPDGELLSDGSMRYKILCDGGLNPSGVFWAKTVPPGADTDTYKAVQAERDEAVQRLKELTSPA